MGEDLAEGMPTQGDEDRQCEHSMVITPPKSEVALLMSFLM